MIKGYSDSLCMLATEAASVTSRPEKDLYLQGVGVAKVYIRTIHGAPEYLGDWWLTRYWGTSVKTGAEQMPTLIFCAPSTSIRSTLWDSTT